MKPLGFLVLAHQARSHVYCGLIKQYCSKHNIQLLVISSSPISDEHIRKIKGHADKVWVINEDDLTTHNTKIAVDEAIEEYHVLGTLATYEGYRLLMAKINADMGVKDANPDALATCMDKFACRKILFSAGLSTVDSHIITADNLGTLKNADKDYFVKPRRGIGSFACFKLRDDLDISVIKDFQQQMETDLRFKNIFDGQFDFIAEQFIYGEEYSFEVIVFEGENYNIGTHAKYVSEMFGTTLETGNTLPAPKLSNSEQLEGELYVGHCLEKLGLNQGAYHIETRYDRETNTWNIIEINARMGGALINQSVEVFTDEYSFLELWFLCLITKSYGDCGLLTNTLAALKESTRRHNKTITQAAVFISKYGEPGRTITRLSIENLRRQPDICEMAVTEGTTLPKSVRGIFILNALWKVDVNSINDELDSLYSILESDLVLDYQTI
jgi:hypothetical protein